MNEFEFDLSEFFLVLKQRIIIILLTTIVFTLASGIFTIFFIDEKYQSSATLFPQLVYSDELIDYEQLNANNALLNTYVQLLKGSDIIAKVSQTLNVDYGVVQGSLSVWKQANTQLISVTATTNSPKLSKDIVDNVLEVFYEDIEKKIQVTNIITVEEAKISNYAISPNLLKNMYMGAFAGIVLSVALIFLQFILDNRLRSKAEAEKYFDLPVLGVIPDMENANEIH